MTVEIEGAELREVEYVVRIRDPRFRGEELTTRDVLVRLMGDTWTIYDPPSGPPIKFIPSAEEAVSRLREWERVMADAAPHFEALAAIDERAWRALDGSTSS